MKKYKQHIIFGGVALLMAIIDIITKVLTQNLSNLSVIEGVVSFDAITNTGAAWSMLTDHTWLLIIFSIVFIGLIIAFHILNKRKTNLEVVALALVVGGAFGNLFDRVFYGGVRDFVRLDFINFPVFNFADSCITIGAILFCIYVVFFLSENKEKNEK